MSGREDKHRASEHLDRARKHAGEAARETKEAMEAGASGTLERTREAAREAGETAKEVPGRAADAARETARTAGHVTDRVRHAEPDRELENRAENRTEKALDRAGEALRSAAPAVGRGMEATVSVAGSALHAVGGPLGLVLGKIAGTVGGWWQSASTAVRKLPRGEQEAYRAHFEAYQNRPASITEETDLAAYTLGYIAADNPDYRDRSFDEIEPDIRHGFDADEEEAYNALRDFTRYGYERVTTLRPSQDADRVSFE